jgi:hypothetical protein
MRLHIRLKGFDSIFPERKTLLLEDTERKNFHSLQKQGEKSDRIHNNKPVSSTLDRRKSTINFESDSDSCEDNHLSKPREQTLESNEREDDSVVDNILNAIAKGSPGACIKMLLYGECKHERCVYSHNQEDLIKAHTMHQQLLDSSKFKPKKQLLNNISILQRLENLDDFRR